MTLDRRCSKFSAVTRSLLSRSLCCTCAVPVKYIKLVVINCLLLQQWVQLAAIRSAGYFLRKSVHHSPYAGAVGMFDLYRTWKGALHDDGGGGACDDGRGACDVTYVYSSSGVSSCADPIKAPCHAKPGQGGPESVRDEKCRENVFKMSRESSINGTHLFVPIVRGRVLIGRWVVGGWDVS